jgi:hypothetical protein
MSLSESVLQSQLALNAPVIRMLHEDIDQLLHIHKHYPPKDSRDTFRELERYSKQIAKYAKLQKALKAELKLVREREKRGAIVEAFITQQVNKLLLEK